MAQTVEAVLNDQDLLRRNVYDVVRDFIERERQHMAMEERFVFPAAVKALRSTDWADIALKLADHHDPLFQPNFEEQFNALRRKILQMEEEAEGLRSSATPS